MEPTCPEGMGQGTGVMVVVLGSGLGGKAGLRHWGGALTAARHKQYAGGMSPARALLALATHCVLKPVLHERSLFAIALGRISGQVCLIRLSYTCELESSAAWRNLVTKSMT